jgi:hypothetical protein
MNLSGSIDLRGRHKGGTSERHLTLIVISLHSLSMSASYEIIKFLESPFASEIKQMAPELAA